ncbi:MAG: hypothetical protein SFW09_19795 [Hyphomicrobiaceae bacterium]|nr:hypothetical protein [Hyphomicrobiaceae bacterium]
MNGDEFMQLMTVILAPGSLNHIANIVKGYAIAIGIAFAMWFVWQWWRTRQRETEIERSARARAVWSRHLALALQHPELAEPPAGTAGAASPRYQTFVAALLTAADEILALEPTEAWRATLARQLAPHQPYLATPQARATVVADCSPAVRALVGGAST